MDNQCLICTDDFAQKKLWHCKRCHQAFHYKCIIEWKKKTDNYPVYFICPACTLKYRACCCIKWDRRFLLYLASSIIICLSIVLMLYMLLLGVLIIFYLIS